MNKHKIGSIFEEEAFRYLKESFSSVRKLKSGEIYDFEIKVNEETKFVEAKIIKNGATGTKPFLSFRQRNADFLITKMNGNIILFDKDYIAENINNSSDATTIRINEETKKMLDKIKVHPRETYDDILKRAINKLMEEKKDNKMTYSHTLKGRVS